jgi:hypothetical protein
MGLDLMPKRMQSLLKLSELLVCAIAEKNIGTKEANMITKRRGGQTLENANGAIA